MNVLLVSWGVAWRGLLLLVAAGCVWLAFAGCGDLGDGVTAVEEVGNEDVFRDVIAPIFEMNCTFSECHDADAPQQNMNLTPAAAFDNIVNVSSIQEPSLKRVLPGDPANSYLFQKITQNSPSMGRRMPLDRPMLSAQDIEAIRQWILGLQ